MMRSTFINIALATCLILSARPHPVQRADFTFKNGQDAIALNAKFKSLSPDSSCTAGQNACVDNKFAQCAALPLVNSPGTSIACTTAADRDERISATGAKAGDAPPLNDSCDPPVNSTNSSGGVAAQTSLTLHRSVIAQGFRDDGQDVPTAGQVASLTSWNNFINFCKTVNFPLTNGKQVAGGSCNPAPMGTIPSAEKIPSSKFVFPGNGATIAANKKFTVQMAIKNLATGNFVNADQNYFSAPQQLDGQGLIKGHSHVVIQKLTSLQQTTPVNPKSFVFFKGLNSPASGRGILTADVEKGLPAGAYRLSSINTAANHQPALVPVAQHGALDDTIYFTVKP